MLYLLEWNEYVLMDAKLLFKYVLRIFETLTIFNNSTIN